MPLIHMQRQTYAKIQAEHMPAAFEFKLSNAKPYETDVPFYWY